MDDEARLDPPLALENIMRDARDLAFDMACEPRTGAFLRSLVASRPAGRILELGTGVGASTAWLRHGMDKDARLLTVDHGPAAMAVARRWLGDDPRIEFVEGDGGALLSELQGRRFDLVFADTWPGKYYQLDDALALVERGGMYVVDDMLPQANWPEGHAPKVAALIQTLEQRTDFFVTKLRWSSGIILATRRDPV